MKFKCFLLSICLMLTFSLTAQCPPVPFTCNSSSLTTNPMSKIDSIMCDKCIESLMQSDIDNEALELENKDLKVGLVSTSTTIIVLLVILIIL